MSKSRTKRYYMDDDVDYENTQSNRKRFEDRRHTKKMKQAVKTQHLEYIKDDDDSEEYEEKR